VYADLVTGMQKVINGPIPYEFTGFAADPRFKPELMLSVTRRAVRSSSAKTRLR
jgi:hypothetical protein